MEMLNDILKEELERLRQLEKIYKEEIARLPRGSLVKKNINGNIYYYMNYRDNGKGIFKYIGKMNEEELRNKQAQIDERRKLKKLLRKVRKDIEKLEKMIDLNTRTGVKKKVKD